MAGILRDDTQSIKEAARGWSPAASQLPVWGAFRTPVGHRAMSEKCQERTQEDGCCSLFLVLCFGHFQQAAQYPLPPRPDITMPSTRAPPPPRRRAQSLHRQHLVQL